MHYFKTGLYSSYLQLKCALPHCQVLIDPRGDDGLSDAEPANDVASSSSVNYEGEAPHK